MPVRSILLVLFSGIITLSCSLPITLVSGLPTPTQIPPTQEIVTSIAITPITNIPTETPNPTQTEIPSLSPTQSRGETPVSTPSKRRTVSPEALANLPRYLVQSGTPLETANFLHPEAGCNWMGIGGQVFNNSGEPVIGLIVEVGGIFEGKPVLLLGITGGAKALGSGGFEIPISGHVVSTKDELWVQVFDQNGMPQSAKINFDTHASCEQNLIIINFSELPSTLFDQFYNPIILR